MPCTKVWRCHFSLSDGLSHPLTLSLRCLGMPQHDQASWNTVTWHRSSCCSWRLTGSLGEHLELWTHAGLYHTWSLEKPQKGNINDFMILRVFSSKSSHTWCFHGLICLHLISRSSQGGHKICDPNIIQLLFYLVNRTQCSIYLIASILNGN